MDLTTEFRRHADECRRMARSTVAGSEPTRWVAGQNAIFFIGDLLV